MGRLLWSYRKAGSLAYAGLCCGLACFGTTHLFSEPAIQRPAESVVFKVMMEFPLLPRRGSKIFDFRFIVHYSSSYL